MPAYWRTSINIANAWEHAQCESPTPQTRKVALRAAMVMSADRGGVFEVLSRLVRLGLGGAIAGGKQYMSWIHEHDFVRAIEFIINQESIDGPINLAAPSPIPQGEFMTELRRAWGVWLGLPATRWMIEIGAFFIRTDTELLLKSRRVIPGRLVAAGYKFELPEWRAAAVDLVNRFRHG